MLLINDTPAGDLAVFCAPKTGTTSLTWIALYYEHNHRDAENWHEMPVDVIGDRQVVLMVRDPRERLISLWQHWMREKRQILTFELFFELPKRPFFSSDLCQWYQGLLDRDYLTIRLESFHQDIERIIGWKHPLHANSTQHKPWTAYRHVIDNTDWWKRDAQTFGYLPTMAKGPG